MWSSQATLEFRVKLYGEEPGVVFEFDDFDQITFRPDAGNTQTVGYEFLAVLIVHFKAVPMPFGNCVGAKCLVGQ